MLSNQKQPAVITTALTETQKQVAIFEKYYGTFTSSIKKNDTNDSCTLDDDDDDSYVL